MVEHDGDVAARLAAILSGAGHPVAVFAKAEAGLAHAFDALPALALFALAMPDLDGIECCRRLRAEPSANGVRAVLVAERGRERALACGLAAGADDYVLRPFAPEELRRKLAACLRRGPLRAPDPDAPLARDGLLVEPELSAVEADGERAHLTSTELRILQWLLSHPGRVFPREFLVARVIREGGGSHPRNIDVHIGAIRRKLGSHRARIQTVRGIGYRFHDEP